MWLLYLYYVNLTSLTPNYWCLLHETPRHKLQDSMKRFCQSIPYFLDPEKSSGTKLITCKERNTSFKSSIPLRSIISSSYTTMALLGQSSQPLSSHESHVLIMDVTCTYAHHIHHPTYIKWKMSLKITSLHNRYKTNDQQLIININHTYYNNSIGPRLSLHNFQ